MAAATNKCPTAGDLRGRDVDAWERKFLISCVGRNPLRVMVTSVGRDGELGTVDDIRTEFDAAVCGAGPDREMPDVHPPEDIEAPRAGMPPGAPEFAAGDYMLTMSATRNVKKPRSASGSISLRPLVSEFDNGLGHPFYGWTDVDFAGLGATVDARDNSPKSRDPENPGVLVVSMPANNRLAVDYLNLPASGGAVLMLIGSVQNRKATRSHRDGGGIGLKAQAWDGGCLVGDWVSMGIVHGAEGRYRLCRN